MQLRGGTSMHGVPALMVLHRRAKWAALLFVVFFFVLIGRLWQLQVLRGDSYYQRTVSNVVRERFLPSVRGKILDRSGMPLADNRPAFNIYVTPASFKPCEQRWRACWAWPMKNSKPLMRASPSV
jgi:cell division protein FtsI/penicillin-binding protein 2